MRGTLGRTCSHCSTNAPWNTTAIDVGVVPQVDELVGGVAVVGVDRGEADLERGEDRLHVLRRVVQVLGDLVLFHGTGREQRGGDAVGAAVELRPRERARRPAAGRGRRGSGRPPSPRGRRGSIRCRVPRRSNLPAVGSTVSRWGQAPSGRDDTVDLSAHRSSVRPGGPWSETVVGGGDGGVLVHRIPHRLDPPRRTGVGVGGRVSGRPSSLRSRCRTGGRRDLGVDLGRGAWRSRRGSGSACTVVVEDLGDHAVPPERPSHRLLVDRPRPTHQIGTRGSLDHVCRSSGTRSARSGSACRRRRTAGRSTART